jgi:hypothetical protein
MPAVTPSEYALTDPASFLAYLGEPEDSDGANTDKAQRLINGYSKAVRRYTRRQFKPTEDSVEKVFQYIGNGFLSLAPYEARNITTVTLYTDLPTTGWQVLDNQDQFNESQWRANPRNRSEEGTYWSLVLPEIGPYHPYFDMPVTTLNRRNLWYEVTVLGDWGVATVPEDVELAVWIACANAWRNPEGYQHRMLGPLSATDYQEPADTEGLMLPRASRALLKEYKRRSTGVR